MSFVTFAFVKKNKIPSTVYPITFLIFLLSASFLTITAQAQQTKHRFKTINKIKSEYRAVDLSYMADSSVLNRSDYLTRLQTVFQTINEVKVVTSSFTKLPAIEDHLTQDESAVGLLKERLKQSDRSLNLQNLQMYQTLLDELDKRNEACLKDLQDYDESLNEVKTQILTLRKDTVLHRIFVTDSLKAIFKPQLTDIGKKRLAMDSLIKTNTSIINSLEARTSANIININELTYLTDGQINSAGLKAFSKERRYLWEPSAPRNGKNGMSMQRFMQTEQQLSKYYFVYTRSSRLLLLFTGVVFFFWVFFNFKSLKVRDRLDAIKAFEFNFIREKPFQISIVLILTLAPVFDLLAPSLYIELVHIILSISLAALFFKRLPRDIFFKWCLFALLLIAPAILRMLGLPPRFQRWVIFFFSLASCAFGVLMYKQLKNKVGRYKILLPVGLIYIAFNFMAIVCNLFGRYTLTQIFYTTAVSAFLHAVSLIIMASMFTEALLLQIKSSRIRKHYPENFDWVPVVQSIKSLFNIVIFLIWLTLFLVNLNIFDGLYDFTLSILTEKRTIGSLSFTFGGIVLFLLIIWFANFLQKYIAYFFGDTGDDSLDDNKGERSKLIVTRLVLLTGGFLLAVAASGLPIDKITVVLGALGVGIGLGLQNIVSNFVSGIILIFDKTLRIGDVVELSDKKGRVKEIGIRASTLLTDDGAEIIIPNGNILSNNIINWTLTNNQMRIVLEYVISKPYNHDEVVDIIKTSIAANENILLVKEPRILINPKTKTSSSVKIYFWCKDISQGENTQSSINAIIYDQLEAKGIDIL